MSISHADLGLCRRVPAQLALLTLAEFWRCWQQCQAGFREIWGKVLKGICWVCVLCSRDILPASPKVSIVCLFLIWGGGKEGGIIIRHFHSHAEWGRAQAVYHRNPSISARVQEKNKSGFSCAWLFFTRQTFNYCTFMQLMNQWREIQEIMYFYFYTLY